jgi:hypothetical protein
LALIDAYRVGSILEMDMDYIFMTTQENGAAVFNIKPDAIPSVTILDKSLHDNITLLTTTINEQSRKNILNILGDLESNSPYLGTTSNLYWERFIKLKPKVDKIISLIRSYLKT